MTAITKPKTYGDFLAARLAVMNSVIADHNTALGEFENAKLVRDYCAENPAEFTQEQRRQFGRDLMETREALSMISAEDADWQAKKTGDDFIYRNAAAIAAAARVSLSELTAKLPSVREPILSGIFEKTRHALGLSPHARGETLEARDQAEQTLADLEIISESVATRIAYFEANTSLDSLNDVTGALGQLTHAITTAAKP